MLPNVDPPSDQIVSALCATAIKLGIMSLRAPVAALHVARLHAALAGRTTITDADAIASARVVLAPRARVLPAEDQAEPDTPEPQHDAAPNDGAPPDDPSPPSDAEQPDLDDLMIAAALASIPSGLLEAIKHTAGARSPSATEGRSGAKRSSTTRGRAIGDRAAAERTPPRLDLLATLRAAAPWQRLRSAEPAARNSATPSVVSWTGISSSRVTMWIAVSGDAITSITASA